MIAIAGAKGGCGKTTVTLGLASAFADRGVPALAIDADRQLPNLHVLAEVDRTPTIAAVRDGSDVRTVAQQHPKKPNVGILPAPTAEQHVDYEAVLDAMEPANMQVLVDCPSGAGPDAVEAIRAADGVIVVTTPTDRGISAAETTIEMARRLDQPIHGVLATHCDSLPDRLADWTDVPLLGPIPDRPTPLLNDDCSAAFEDVVETLAHQTPAKREPRPDDGRLRTGITALDDALGGGVEPGSVLVLRSNPASQAETLLYRMCGMRGTLFLSTVRSKTAVSRAMDATPEETGNPTIRAPGGSSDATELIDKLPDGATLVLDTVDGFECEPRAEYLELLDRIATRTAETGGLAILHCHARDPAPEHRPETLYAADVVVDFERLESGPGDAPAQHLTVSKRRTSRTLPSPVTLDLEPEQEAIVLGPESE